jgi:hypothetical protein
MRLRGQVMQTKGLETDGKEGVDLHITCVRTDFVIVLFFSFHAMLVA